MLKRYRIIAIILIITILGIDVRLFYLSYYQNKSVSAERSASVETYGTGRALILDTHMKPLVEYESRKVTAVSNPSYVFSVPKRYSDTQLCPHIIGYTDYSHAGVSGIEKDYNAFLKSIPNQITLKTYYDAAGNRLLGKGTVKDTSRQCTDSGVCLTIEKDIQTIVQSSAKSIGKGAVIVMNADSGAICALASLPDFNPNAVEKYVNDEINRPLVNRALLRYNVGSVFKVVVCLAALEQGITEQMQFYCKGYTACGGVTFHCHKEDGHGTLNMREALAVSCNTYFIELARKVGYQKICEICKRLGIESQITLSPSLAAQAGVLPSEKNLHSPAALANFSFGQGELMCSPLWLGTLYSAIFNGGYYVTPQLVKGTAVNGHLQEKSEPTQKKRVIQSKYAYAVLKMLRYTVIHGTGQQANNEKYAVAGKTATAQTGYFEGNNEKLTSYFIGLTAIKGDMYTIVVMCEGGTSGSLDCVPVFKEICDKIYALKEKQR